MPGSISNTTKETSLIWAMMSPLHFVFPAATLVTSLFSDQLLARRSLGLVSPLLRGPAQMHGGLSRSLRNFNINNYQIPSHFILLFILSHWIKQRHHAVPFTMRVLKRLGFVPSGWRNCPLNFDAPAMHLAMLCQLSITEEVVWLDYDGSKMCIVGEYGANCLTRPQQHWSEHKSKAETNTEQPEWKNGSWNQLNWRSQWEWERADRLGSHKCITCAFV